MAQPVRSRGQSLVHRPQPLDHSLDTSISAAQMGNIVSSCRIRVLLVGPGHVLKIALDA